MKGEERTYKEVKVVELEETMLLFVYIFYLTLTHTLSITNSGHEGRGVRISSIVVRVSYRVSIVFIFYLLLLQSPE